MIPVLKHGQWLEEKCITKTAYMRFLRNVSGYLLRDQKLDDVRAELDIIHQW